MKMPIPVSCAVFVTLLSAAFAVEPTRDAEYRGTLKNLKPVPSVLGAQWVSVPGLVIEDIADVESHPAEVRPVVEGLKKQLEPLGVRKAADFSYRVPSELSRFVTLRVFVFDSPESCSRWWEKKYRHEGWEKFYKPVEGVAYEAVDSTDSPKRAVAIGNVLLTCHALKATDNYVAVLDACIQKLMEPVKSE